MERERAFYDVLLYISGLFEIHTFNEREIHFIKRARASSLKIKNCFLCVYIYATHTRLEREKRKYVNRSLLPA